MVSFKLHKVAGVLIGLWLFNLSLTGLLLNHEKNLFQLDFMWQWTLPSRLFSSDALKMHRFREVSSYKVHPENGRQLIGSMRGLFVNTGEGFKQVFKGRVFKIEPYRDKNLKEDYSTVFLATDDGIYRYSWNGMPQPAGMQGMVITAISVYGNTVFCAVEKKFLYRFDLVSGKAEEIEIKSMPKVEHINFRRFVRDFHYGRGVADQPVSAVLNDIVSAWWLWLIVSGYLIFFLYRQSKKRKIQKVSIRKLVFFHSNVFTLIMIPFIFLLALTGLFIDHPRFFSPLINFNLPLWSMPPVYHSPEKDIWDIDYDGKVLRVGNRFGLYTSSDMKNFLIERKGFAYKLRRIENRLYLSGMGAPSGYFDGKKWHILKLHMPVDFVLDGKPVKRNELPVFSKNIPFYTFMVTLHDGSFFHRYFIFLNDVGAVLTFVLLFTGTVRYIKRRR
ncbi:PepSY domain-containing protein [Persephonella sp.]